MNIISKIRNSLKRNKARRKFIQRSVKEMQIYAEMPFMSPYLVTLKKWLNGVHGDTSRLKWLTDEVMKYQNSMENHQLDGHVYILAKENEYLLALDEEAVRILADDVLQGFFGKEECIREYTELYQLNQMPRMYRDIYENLFLMNHQQMQELEQVWQECPVEEIRRNVMYMIQKVRRQRKLM